MDEELYELVFRRLDKLVTQALDEELLNLKRIIDIKQDQMERDAETIFELRAEVCYWRDGLAGSYDGFDDYLGCLRRQEEQKHDEIQA